MAFLLQNWCRASASANEPVTTLTSGVIVGCFRQYNYQTADAQATVAASGYFNTGVTGAGVAYDIVTGDYVNVYSSASSSLITYRLVNTAGVITTTFVSGSVTLTPTVTLTQFLAAYATPLEVAPVPGAGLVYTNVRAVMVFTYGSAQLANGGDSFIQYGTTVNGGGHAATSSVLGTGIAALTASNSWAYGSGSTVPAVTPAGTTIVNASLCLTNLAAPFITGTAATFTLKLRAEIMSAT
jgi:hypothetical protein